MFYPLNTWQNSIHHYYCGTNSKIWTSAVWVKIWKCVRMMERKPTAVHSLREKSNFYMLVNFLFSFWKSSFWRCKNKVLTLFCAYITVLVTRGYKDRNVTVLLPNFPPLVIFNEFDKFVCFILKPGFLIHVTDLKNLHWNCRKTSFMVWFFSDVCYPWILPWLFLHILIFMKLEFRNISCLSTWWK